jgi:hypothetical protein
MDETTSESTDGIEWSGRKKATEFIKSLSQGAIDIVRGKPILARPELRIERLAQCWEPCEYYQEEEDRCGVCSCKVNAKTAALRQSCPVGKW